MNETLKLIKERRSVRTFLPDAVPQEILEQIIEAGIFAPSGRNMQSPIVVAVTDPAVRDRLAKTNAAIMGSDRAPFYGAPVILIVLAKKSCPTYVYDGSLVMGNLMLAAHTLGVSSCWIHRAKETFEMPEWIDWLRSIGITDEVEGIGHCALGYTTASPDPIPRKDGRVFFVR